MNDEEDFDVKRDRLSKANDRILKGFIDHVVGSKKQESERMQKYSVCLQFFGDEYLCNYQGVDLLEGLDHFRSFVGDWFIRKCMWSDEASLRENLDAFEEFLGYLEETGQVAKERADELRRGIEEDRSLYFLRVKYYNDPEVDLEEILDKYGCWDDEALLELEALKSMPQHSPGEGRLVFNLLFSARAAKFFKLKPPQLAKLKDTGKSWEDPSEHWLSNWRCEECFSMAGTKERVFILSNEASRFSFLFRLAPGDIKGLFQQFHEKLMKQLKKRQVPYPSTIELQIATLSGAARSLTGCQNNLLIELDHYIDRGDFEYLDELEPKLNKYLTTIHGDYEYPKNEFARLCEEDPPFAEGGESDKIIPFLN